MERRTVQLRVAGQTYRVVTTASDGELKRLVGVIEDKLAEVTPRGRPPAPSALLLVALALVHEVEEARGQASRVESHAREALSRLVERIDAALVEGEAEPAPPPAPAPPS
jgi:cell division protein ZapA